MKGDNGYNEQGNVLCQSGVKTQPYRRVLNTVKDGTIVSAWFPRCRALSKAVKFVTFVNAPFPLGDVGGVQWLRLTSA